MNITETAAELRELLAQLRRAGKSIAFVPTMGCLHEGHMQLVAEAKQRADIVVLSIYVNPLQFGPNEDFGRYPRTFDTDARLCEAAGVDVIFHPENLYPAQGPLVTLKAEGITDSLCGAARPGHFDGVVTVVNILFNIVQPDMALFGEKDWQQLAVIRRMVSDLQMPLEIIGVETVREADGLAKSSRNRYLEADDRQRAVAISQALRAMQAQTAAGECDAETLIATARASLAEQQIEPEYLEIRDAATLAPLSQLNEQPARVFIAADVGKARLIDNMRLAVGPHTTGPLASQES